MNPYPQQPYAPPQAPYRGFAEPSPNDTSHLDALAVCHFVYGGLVAFIGCLGLLYLLLGAGMAAVISQQSGGEEASAAIGGVFAVLGGVIMVLCWAKAAAVIYSGLSLQRRKRMTFSFVVACIMCLAIPFGTVLGVFTLIVLSRPSVKALYDRVGAYGA